MYLTSSSDCFSLCMLSDAPWTYVRSVIGMFLVGICFYKLFPFDQSRVYYLYFWIFLIYVHSTWWNSAAVNLPFVILHAHIMYMLLMALIIVLAHHFTNMLLPNSCTSETCTNLSLVWFLQVERRMCASKFILYFSRLISIHQVDKMIDNIESKGPNFPRYINPLPWIGDINN